MEKRIEEFGLHSYKTPVTDIGKLVCISSVLRCLQNTTHGQNAKDHVDLVACGIDYLRSCDELLQSGVIILVSQASNKP